MPGGFNAFTVSLFVYPVIVAGLRQHTSAVADVAALAVLAVLTDFLAALVGHCLYEARRAASPAGATRTTDGHLADA